MLQRNLDSHEGLCNGTILICRSLQKHVIIAEIARGAFKGNLVCIPRLPLDPSNCKLPIEFQCIQFPLHPSFALSINNSQGQSLKFIGLYLPIEIFTHGQLYVALSRVSAATDISVMIVRENRAQVTTNNVVFKEILAL